MEITNDVHLKGTIWKEVLKRLDPFFSQKTTQPNYNAYAICASIGIMYDKQEDKAGDDLPEDETDSTVPRLVLHPHSTDLDFLFQTAILSTSLVNYSDKERMDLAFNPSTEMKFHKMDFLTKFANYGAIVLNEKLTDDPVVSMENIKTLLTSTMENWNFDIDGIPDEDLDIEDLM